MINTTYKQRALEDTTEEYLFYVDNLPSTISMFSYGVVPLSVLKNYGLLTTPFDAAKYYVGQLKTQLDENNIEARFDKEDLERVKTVAQQKKAIKDISPFISVLLNYCG